MAYKFNPFTSNFDYYEIGSGATPTVVANYSALPAANTVSGQFYWCSASQGTSWLPGWVGGTYYNKGSYYSNGVTWEYMDVPFQATQTEVNTGTNTDKFVTPDTLSNSTQFQYLDATSSIQTQLDSKLSAMDYFNVNNLTIVDLVAYFIGQSTTAGITVTQLPLVPVKAGTVTTIASEIFSASTIGSNEGGTLEFFYNDGANSTVISSDFKVDANRHAFVEFTGLNISVNAGNTYFVYTAGELSTNPTAIQFGLTFT